MPSTLCWQKKACTNYIWSLMGEVGIWVRLVTPSSPSLLHLKETDERKKGLPILFLDRGLNPSALNPLACHR